MTAVFTGIVSDIGEILDVREQAEGLRKRRTRVVKPGRLQVVATPIGNLSDLSERARQALEEADLIAAEDTRHTLGMLQAIGISKPMVSLHAYNEGQRVPDLLERLGAGEVIALVSDAGTPLLSDPGFELVSAAAGAGFEVRVIPGPSAITAALAAAQPAVTVQQTETDAHLVNLWLHGRSPHTQRAYRADVDFP